MASKRTKFACQTQHRPTTLVAEAVKDDGYKKKPKILRSCVLAETKLPKLSCSVCRRIGEICVWNEESGMIRARL